MGRPRRVHVRGGLYHVMVRGNNRADIFGPDEDRRKFLELLEIALDRHGQRLHAYCLMTNHAHLLLQMAEGPISLLAHDLCFRYARWMNRRLHRTGHFFERRHRSILIESDRQLLLALRYIHRNPILGGLARTPDGHEWSSHQAYLGRTCRITVATDICLGLLHADAGRAATRYRRLVSVEDERCLEDLLPPMGATRAVEAAASALAAGRRGDAWRRNSITLDHLVDVIEREFRCGRRELRGRSRHPRLRTARALAAALVRELPRVRLQDLAREFGRDASTLSNAATAFATEARRTTWARTLYERVARRLGIEPLGPG